MLLFIWLIVAFAGIVVLGIKDSERNIYLHSENAEWSDFEKMNNVSRKVLWLNIAWIIISALPIIDLLLMCNDENFGKSPIFRSDYDSGFSTLLVIAAVFGVGFYIYTLIADIKDSMFGGNRIQLAERISVVGGYKEWLNGLIEKYGQYDTIIDLDTSEIKFISDPGFDRNKKFVVFSEPGVIVIGDKEIRIPDITSCEISDDVKYKTNGTVESSTKLGEVVGRSVIGGAIAGSTGAMIGGNSAKRYSDVDEVTEVIHNYKVYVGVKDVKEPYIVVQCGKKEDLAKKIKYTIESLKV